MSTHAPLNDRCPCGSTLAYADCCGRFLDGGAQPTTAEALMRSRYTAFVLGNADYLRNTWASATRPETLSFDRDAIRWIGLEIIACQDGGSDDTEGFVEFLARGLVGDRLTPLHETSRFIREDGAWRYLEGTLHPVKEEKIGRNAECPCGSGRKFKRCCGAG